MISRRAFGAACVLLLATGSLCSAEVRFSGGDGSSFGKAVIIQGVRNEREGVAAEYAWLGRNYTGWKLKLQSQVGKKRRSYDIMDISNGSKSVSVYFDITSFFGKF